MRLALYGNINQNILYIIYTYISFIHTYPLYIHIIYTYISFIHTYPLYIHILYTYISFIHTYPLYIHIFYTYISFIRIQKSPTFVNTISSKPAVCSSVNRANFACHRVVFWLTLIHWNSSSLYWCFWLSSKSFELITDSYRITAMSQ